ncbi:PfkB family carbohydrate kinase [Microbispora sp. H10949]|uniref:PfkB family carbohydrate kinase n=1 Tax=Microbispora sp. H10949 TaxID=2729111 RepID=UPI0015FEE491|nr:PfkB family carbohydrate kinase [Microbispora sp. H10949]
MTVLAVGAYTVDLYMFGDHLPGPGESVGASGYATAHGGKAANVAVASARLGAPTRFVGGLGDDADSLAALAALRADGIETGGCAAIDGVATGRSFVYVDKRGGQIVMTWPGAADLLPPSRAADAAAGLRPGSVLVLQGEIPVATSAAAAAAAPPGVRVLLNPSPAGPFLSEIGEELLRRADVLVLNDGELAALTGPADEARPAAAGSDEGVSPAESLLPRTRGRTVVVTLGERGAEIAGDHGTMLIGVPRVNAVDTTGAGDAFTGALAAALRAGASVAQGVRLACRVAAVSVTRRFCAPSYPSASELGIAPLQGSSGQENPGETTPHPGSPGT